jgi:hypothetical protein
MLSFRRTHHHLKDLLQRHSAHDVALPSDIFARLAFLYILSGQGHLQAFEE